MKRSHRSAHRALWPLLAALVGFGLLMSLLMRAPPPAPPAIAAKPIETTP